MVHFFANWKMYLSFDESVELATALSKASFPQGVTIALFPSMLALAGVSSVLKQSAIGVGAQRAYWVDAGAYTGEESFDHAAQAGAQYTLIGHSERRHVFGEHSSQFVKEYAAAVASGLRPVLCVGETKEDRDAQKTHSVVTAQIHDVLQYVDISTIQPIIAYEPVWAISRGGVGESCSPEMAKEVLAIIRSSPQAANCPVLYGGSVNSENVHGFVGGHNGFDGVLVGHGSTNKDGFLSILSALSY